MTARETELGTLLLKCAQRAQERGGRRFWLWQTASGEWHASASLPSFGGEIPVSSGACADPETALGRLLAKLVNGG